MEDMAGPHPNRNTPATISRMTPKLPIAAFWPCPESDRTQALKDTLATSRPLRLPRPAMGINNLNSLMATNRSVAFIAQLHQEDSYIVPILNLL